MHVLRSSLHLVFKFKKLRSKGNRLSPVCLQVEKLRSSFAKALRENETFAQYNARLENKVMYEVGWLVNSVGKSF